MDEKGMSMSDYLVLEKVGNRQRGIAATGLGIGIGALALGIAGLWGLNAASQARAHSAEKVTDAHALALQQAISNGQEANRTLATLIGTERASRESWQAANQPSITQTLELQNNPSLQSTVQDIVTAMATAAASATANANGINSAVGGDNYLRAMLYSAPQPCGCPGCNQ